VNRYISQLRTLNSYAKTKGYAHSDVVFSGHFLKESPSKENVLGTDDLEALLDAEPEYLNNPIEFSILTGLRKGNVRDLQIRQVNFTSATVTMVAKGKKMHSVPLLPRAVEILREAIGDRTEGYVFLNNGLPMGDFKKAWATKKRNAGIPKDFRWHDLRHTFASWCVGNGMPITLAQELLGHKNLSTTMRYAHYGREAATKSLHDTIGRKIVTKRSGANG
jgi:integrase